MNLIIGADGKVHAGWRLLQTDCGVEGLRLMGPHETWWAEEPDRPCRECLVEVTNQQGEAQ